MDAGACLKRLIYVLSERDIGLGHDDLDWLFDSADTRDDMVAWVNEYLSEQTLLSREELELCSELSEDTSFVSALADSDAPARPLEQIDFENSIKALEKSTAAIDQQCILMESQLEAMREIQKHNSHFPPPCDSKSRVPPPRLGPGKPDIETERLADALQRRITNLQRDAHSATATLKTGVQRQLDKDDRLLDGLQKLMANVEPSESREKQIAEVADLSQALVSLQATFVKNRANQVYLSARKEHPGSGNHIPDEDALEESTTLANELDSLIGEVDAVLDMVIDHQYRRPILENLRQRDAEVYETRQTWLSYVRKALQQMTDRLHDIFMTTQDLDAYSNALGDISDTLSRFSAAPAPASLNGGDGKGQPPRSRPVHKSIQQLVLPATSGAHPAHDLLRHHGIRVAPPSAKEGQAKATIEAAIAERTSRLAGLSLSTEQGIARHVSDSINMADARLQGLLEAVYAYSPYATVNLADPDCSDRLRRLNKDVDALAGELKQVELNGLIERERRQLDEIMRSGDAILILGQD